MWKTELKGKSQKWHLRQTTLLGSKYVVKIWKSRYSEENFVLFPKGKGWVIALKVEICYLQRSVPYSIKKNKRN